jgi:hypothetical protein
MKDYINSYRFRVREFEKRIRRRLKKLRSIISLIDGVKDHIRLKEILKIK